MRGRATLWIAAALAAAVLALSLTGGGQKGAASQEERRIADVLSAMEGAGRVEVALFYGAGTAGALSGRAALPTGAVVVAQGADDVAVRLRLIRAVRTLLSLPETAVDVFAMEEGR